MQLSPPYGHFDAGILLLIVTAACLLAWGFVFLTEQIDFGDGVERISDDEPDARALEEDARRLPY